MEQTNKVSHKPVQCFYTFFSSSAASGFSVKTKVEAEKPGMSRTAQLRFMKKLDNSGG